jgi:hypothetical protein
LDHVDSRDGKAGATCTLVHDVEDEARPVDVAPIEILGEGLDGSVVVSIVNVHVDVNGNFLPSQRSACNTTSSIMSSRFAAEWPAMARSSPNVFPMKSS